MRLFELIRAGTEGRRLNIVLAAGASGLSNAGILAIINKVAKDGGGGGTPFFLIVLFILAMAVYIYCLRYTMNMTAQIFEDIVDSVRRAISEKIRASDLMVLDRIGKSRIYNTLTQETTVLTDASRNLSAGLQAALMVVFACLYMAFLSLMGFVLTVIMIGLGVVLFMNRRKETVGDMDAASRKEVAFIDSVSHLLDGFKEVRMNRQRSDDLYHHIEHISADVKDSNLRSAGALNELYMFSQYFFYVLIAVIVFVLPRLLGGFDDVLTQMTAAILFIVGPLGMVVGAMNTFTKANHAAEMVFALEQALDAHAPAPIVPPPPRTAFETIQLEATAFSYRSPEDLVLFSMGPADLTVNAGEVLFIIGGNGSGKSTLLKILTALYRPHSGVVRVDGEAVTAQNGQGYRALFSTIFADFHLFDRLFGLPNADPDRVNALLRQMELDKKTQFAGDHFTNLDLSTGQRKRLALVVALLEDRPLFVFDELAADQDPLFRKYLYTELLPGLKAQGKTVVAVTHDDKYFHVADRIVKMEYGQIAFDLTPEELDRLGGWSL